MKILIVEDELIIAEDVRGMLSRMGYEVVGNAMDYSEAIALLENTTPDLVLLDVNLNGKKDGIDLAQTINEAYKIPFIYTTSYSDTPTLQRAKNTNPANYLVKPFKQEQLFTAIEMALYRLSEIPKKETAPTEKAMIIKDALFIRDKFATPNSTSMTFCGSSRMGITSRLRLQIAKNLSERRFLISLNALTVMCFSKHTNRIS
jgi:DNA-binding NarL/FixJ family response regulator